MIADGLGSFNIAETSIHRECVGISHGRGYAYQAKTAICQSVLWQGTLSM